MTEIVIPQLDANSETARLVQLDIPDGGQVRRGENLCTVETSKAVFDVPAEAAGIVVWLHEEGSDVPFLTPIGYIAVDAEEAGRLRTAPPAMQEKGEEEVSATKRARELAREHHLDLSTIDVDGIITEEDVLEALGRSGRLRPIAATPGELPLEVTRVLVIGAGLGAMQAIDILLNRHDVRVVGCLDDQRSPESPAIFGAPVLGPTSRLEELFRAGEFDEAIIAISTSIPARRKFYDECGRLGIPLANAIDPSVRINRGAVIGRGNIICSNCHLGVAARLGDNNFISAQTSIDHHNVWGSHITTGPNIATSGGVVVGDGVKFGTGIFVQPNLAIGADSIIASGAVILSNVPARHIVRTRVQIDMTPRS